MENEGQPVNQGRSMSKYMPYFVVAVISFIAGAYVTRRIYLKQNEVKITEISQPVESKTASEIDKDSDDNKKETSTSKREIFNANY
jgi:hypothetical protein